MALAVFSFVPQEYQYPENLLFKQYENSLLWIESSRVYLYNLDRFYIGIRLLRTNQVSNIYIFLSLFSRKYNNQVSMKMIKWILKVASIYVYYLFIYVYIYIYIYFIFNLVKSLQLF